MGDKKCHKLYSRYELCHKEMKREPNHYAQDVRIQEGQLKYDKSYHT